MTVFFKISLALCIFSIASVRPVFAEDKLWFVKQEHLACLQRELSKYLEQDGDHFVIFISECPERDVVAILQKKTINSSGQVLPTEENTFLKPAEVITFTRKELACVAEIQIKEDQEVIPIPKNPCK